MGVRALPKISHMKVGNFSQERGLTNRPAPHIIATTTKHHKPVTERSTRCGRPSESPRRWERGGERSANGLQRADRTAHTPSRDRRASHPLSIGARMMVRVSEWTFYNVNLGGIAEAAAFVPCVGQRLFCLPFPPPDLALPGFICHLSAPGRRERAQRDYIFRRKIP